MKIHAGIAEPVQRCEISPETSVRINPEKLAAILNPPAVANVDLEPTITPQVNRSIISTSIQDSDTGKPQSRTASRMDQWFTRNRSEMSATINAKKGQTPRSVLSKTRKIDFNTKLLDVLADEFEEKGLNKSVDVNGFQNISGLSSRLEKHEASELNIKDSTDEKKQKGKTSTFMKIKIAPGVSLKEQKDIKREPRNENDYVRTSGGVYRP